MKTGDKDFDKWIKFFSKEKKSMTQYIKMLKHMDKTFLTRGFPQDIDAEDLLPLNGLLEDSFVNVIKSEKEDLSQDYNILVLAVCHGVSFEGWKTIYKEKIEQVFEKALIEGTYEEYGIELEKIISTFITKGLIAKKDFMGISFIRGMSLGKRYNNEEKLKNLEKLIKKNYWKSKLQF